jgi:hypothetical protein
MLLSGIGMSGTAYGQSVFTVHKTGKFHHILSDLPGAYDLAADTQRTTSESNDLKDFVNTDTVGFTGKWKAGNATSFVMAPRWPEFNAQTGSADFTFAKVDSLYKARTVITLQDDPGTGSKHVYITKMRGGSEYVIVKFLTILGGSTGTGGETTFEYWKMPSSMEAAAIRPLASADGKNIRLKPSIVFGLDGRHTSGVKMMSVLGQTVGEGRVSQQKYFHPTGR